MTWETPQRTLDSGVSLNSQGVHPVTLRRWQQPRVLTSPPDPPAWLRNEAGAATLGRESIHGLLSAGSTRSPTLLWGRVGRVVWEPMPLSSNPSHSASSPCLTRSSVAGADRSHRKFSELSGAILESSTHSQTERGTKAPASSVLKRTEQPTSNPVGRAQRMAIDSPAKLLSPAGSNLIRESPTFPQRSRPRVSGHLRHSVTDRYRGADSRSGR